MPFKAKIGISLGLLLAIRNAPTLGAFTLTGGGRGRGGIESDKGRDGQQREIDLVEDRSGGAKLIEIKSGETPSGDWGASLRRIASVFPGSPDLRIVYGGDSRQTRGGVEFLPWRDFCREAGGGLSEI